MSMQTVCPGCGGPTELARSGRVTWHKPWKVGRGGRMYQSAQDPLCTGRVDASERDVELAGYIRGLDAEHLAEEVTADA